MLIRPIEERDLAPIQPLRLEALRAHPEAFGSSYEDAVRDWETFSVPRLRAAVEGKVSRVFLADPGADAGTSLAGMLGVARESGSKVCHSAVLWGVYVRPQFRGQKLAERMVREALEWCASLELRIIRLTVVSCNAAAIRCYLRCGFNVCG